MPKRKFCFFTKNNIDYIDYKNIELLNQFILKNGKIIPSRITGTKAKHQRALSKAIKRARIMALIPYSNE